MSGITINDGTQICYNDWDTEQPVVFGHGWPLSADDLATLVETLDLQNPIHVGHSTGGGEVARYIGRHSTKRVAKGVLIGS
jgi:non-heme chloroperoxidase